MRGMTFSTVQVFDRENYAANSMTLRQILDILLKLSPTNEAAPSRDKHQPAPLSFDPFSSITALYRRGLEAVHLKDRGKQPRADTAISEANRRATASMNGGVFYARNVAEPPITFLWGLLLGSRKACRNLLAGYCRPVGNPRPSTAIESGTQAKLTGGRYHGKNSAYPHARIHPHYPAHLFSPHNSGPGASICLVGGAP